LGLSFVIQTCTSEEVYVIISTAFSALTLLVGHQEKQASSLQKIE